MFIKIFDPSDTVCSDQTGRFPVQSRSGHKYIMAMVHVDSNAVLAEPMKNRTAKEMIRAYRALLNRLRRAGFVVQKHILDNECSAELKEEIEKTCKLQLVPPGSHRANLAEVAIKALKQHMLSILAGVAPDFPWSTWHEILPQVLMTLNLLRTSNSTPSVSAHAHLCGQHDYNAMPLMPIGQSAEVHVRTDVRKSWGFHSEPAWYLYTSKDHHRTHMFLMKKSRTKRLSDTAVLASKRITSPVVSHADAIVNAASQLASTVQSLANSRAARLQTNTHQLVQLTDIVKSLCERNSVTASSPVPPPTPPATSSTNVPAPRVSDTVPRVPAAVPRVPAARPRVSAAAPRMPVDAPRTSPAAPSTLPTDSKPAPPPRPQLAEPVAHRTRSRGPAPAPPPPPPDVVPIASRTRSHGAEALTIALAAAADMGAKVTASGLARRRLPAAVFQTASALAVMCPKTGEMLKYRQLIHHSDPDVKATWTHSAANEFGRLANGVGGRIKDPTNTIEFIRRDVVPSDRFKDVQYGKFECQWRPQKIDEPNRTRLTIGWKGHYPGDVGTPTAEMLLVKILFNSVVSTPGAEFMSIDISDFYLATPLKRKEYLRLSLRDIPEEIIEEYSLRDIAVNGAVYAQVNRGMYGLPQSGLLANELLAERLAKHGYRQSKLIPGLWKHDWRPVTFTLVVDDFGVKYVGREHAEHLQKAITDSGYRIKSDWTGSKYVGITLDWDYDKRRVHLSMPGYNAKALTRFHHEKPTTRQDSPHLHTPPNYGAKVQYAKGADESAPLDKDGQRFIQQLTGTFLFPARAVDSPLLVSLSSIASQQSKPTQQTLKTARQLLDYIASQEEAVLTYNASDMILAAHSDASYLSEPNARSRAGGHIFLSSDVEFPHNNGAILNIAQIIKNVMSSATEAELAALYIIAKECVYIRLILQEMGHPQPPTPIQTDNKTAEGVINNKIQPKRTKAMDMRFHWLRDRDTLRQLRFYWRAGTLNLADYFTKHHSAAHHKSVRGEFLTPQRVLDEARQRYARKHGTKL